MSLPRAALVLILFAATGGTAVAGPVDAKVTDLRVLVHDSELLVSFTLRDAFPPEFRERLHSGLPVSFRHRVEMFARRSFVLVPNKTLGRTIVETKVEYDSLTRQYRLYRHTENKSKAAEDTFVDLEVRRTTQSLDEAVDWLTVLKDVPLPWRSGSETERLRVRVQSNLGRRFLLLLIPSSYSASAELRLEF